MFGLFVLVLVMCVVMMFIQNDRPTAVADGSWRMVDHRDGPVRNAVGLVAVLASIPVTHGAVQLMDPRSVKHPAGWLLIGLFCVGVYAWLIWKFGSRVFEALNAAPGEIQTDHWPLAAGERATVTYRRKFHNGVPAGDMHAYLVLYEVTQGHTRDGKHKSKEKREVKRVRLADGEATYRNKELVGTWHFQVPNPGGNPVEAVTRGFFQLVGDTHLEKEWWEFQVDVPLRAGGEVNSQFKLKIELIAGRSQFHMGH